MKNSCLALFCFVLVFDAVRTEEDLCRKLKTELTDFESKVILQYDQTEYHIEEQRLDRKGKLVVSESGKIEEVYYQNFKKRTRVAFHDRSTNVCKDATLFDDETTSEKRSYKFFHAESGVFGPSALWARIKDRLEEFEYEKSLEGEDAIRRHVCKAENLELPNLGKSTIRLQISDPEWQIFGQKGVPQLLQLHLSASDSSARQFEVKIDYLAFRKLPNTDRQSEPIAWVVPTVCFNFNMVRPFNKLPEKFRMRLNKVDELNGKVSEKYRIVWDRPNQFYSYDKLRDDGQRATRVISPRINMLIETEKGRCFYHDLAKFYEANKELNDLIARLYELNKNLFDHVGSQLVRGIATEVYRYNLLPLSAVGAGADFEITTINVQQKLSELNEFTYFEPVSYRVERFNTSNHLQQSTLYDIYDFDAIESDAQYAEDFQIDECVVPKTEFILAAKNDYKDGELDEQDQKDLRRLLRTKLEMVTGEKPVNFQKIQVTINSNEILASATFRDFENPQMYFFVTDDVLQEERKPDETDIVLTDKQTLEDCAIESLKNAKSAGFQFCDLENEKYCHVITPPNMDVNKLTVRRKDAKCETNRKSVSKDFEFVTFDEKAKMIADEVKADDFVLTHLDHPFNFNKIHFIRDQSDIDQGKLYELQAKGRTFTADATKQTLGAEQGIYSLESCFQACREAKKSNFTCDHFAYCKRPDKTYDCNLGSFIDRSSNEVEAAVAEDAEVLEREAKEGESFTETEKDKATGDKESEATEDERSKKLLDELTKEDENCALYNVSSLDLFKEHSKRKFAAKGVKLVDEIENPQTSSAHCAQFCLDYSGGGRLAADEHRCSSFEFCKNDGKATCRLSSTVTQWDNDRILVEDADCSVYSAQHLLNFYPIGKRPLKNFITEQAISVEQCAAKCDLGNCDLFNYCETDSGNFCHYIGEVNGPGQNGDGFGSELFGCVSYQRRKQMLGALKPMKVELKTEYVAKRTGNGFKVSSVIGFSSLALFVGLVVGSAALSVKRKMCSKSGKAVISVRFSELSEDQL